VKRWGMHGSVSQRWEAEMENDMAQRITTLRAFWSNESGQDLIEYALIAALVALTTVAAMSSLANSISNSFSSAGSQLDSALPSS
jgi:pilus assembly protein Flp/PilA